jgi:hypothetical protein
MAKEKKKKEVKRASNVKPSGQPDRKPDLSPTDPPSDFGGLPPRDLKKNLGCG